MKTMTLEEVENKLNKLKPQIGFIINQLTCDQVNYQWISHPDRSPGKPSEQWFARVKHNNPSTFARLIKYKGMWKEMKELEQLKKELLNEDN